MKTFNVEIVADSINPDQKRITSVLLTYPRFIHSELMTHRSFSRNAASSRAIPIQKVIDQINESPAMPVRWGVNGKGMQDHGVADEDTIDMAKNHWLTSAAYAVMGAGLLSRINIHKQISNRILEPYVWMTTLVTATEWENFFFLRVHKDAQPEFQHLAYLLLKAYLSNTPSHKEWGEWHIPFGERMPEGIDESVKLKIAVARAARTSYLTMDGKIDVEKDIKLHDDLQSAGHFSPFEHAAKAEAGNFGNFIGWKQYRKFLPQDERKGDLHQLLKDYEESIKNTEN